MILQRADKQEHETRLGLLLGVGGLVGFIASCVLTIDKFKLLQDPSYVPSCNISPVISCGSVMSTPQASVFGFANSLIGVAGFAAVMLLGLSLLAGALYRRWFWLVVQTGVVLGLLFVHWLIYQSLYQLGTLCPYCVGIWVVTIPIGWYITVRNVREGVFGGWFRGGKVRTFILAHPGDLLAAWYLIVALLVLQRFWYYWQTLL